MIKIIYQIKSYISRPDPNFFDPNFFRNEQRLAFPTVKALNLPIGSGAIESSIRRVVNLRLKGPCTFWYRENAEKRLPT
jgi:hypothetical protein